MSGRDVLSNDMLKNQLNSSDRCLAPNNDTQDFVKGYSATNHGQKDLFNA